jgi:hypothetical protein
MSGESIAEKTEIGIVFQFRLRKCPRSEIRAPTSESSKRSKMKKENHLYQILEPGR